MTIIDTWAFLFEPNYLEDQKNEILKDIEKHQENKLSNNEVIALVVTSGLFINIFSNALYDYYKGSVNVGTKIAFGYSLFALVILIVQYLRFAGKYKPKKPSFHISYNLSHLAEHDDDMKKMAEQFKRLKIDFDEFGQILTSFDKEFLCKDLRIFQHHFGNSLKLAGKDIDECARVEIVAE